jgi:hypothetical protein
VRVVHDRKTYEGRPSGIRTEAPRGFQNFFQNTRVQFGIFPFFPLGFQIVFGINGRVLQGKKDRANFCRGCS